MMSLEAHLDLRMAALARHRSFRPTTRTRERVREHLEPLHAQGEAHALTRGGVVRAVLAWRYDPTPWCGAPVTAVALDHDLEHDPLRWLEEVLDQIEPRFAADLELLLDVSYRRVARALLERGYGVDSVQLLGDCATALERLRAGPFPGDLRVAPLRSEHVEEVIALYRQTFSAHPEFCWFGANEPYLADFRESLEDELVGPNGLQRVVLLRGRLCGHAAATVMADNAFWGPTAGMGLVLAPALRGRGLLRPLYRELLEGMRERGARSFRGGTSQPPVMHLAEEMGRPLQGWLIRRGATFPRHHFGGFAP